jgi:hypothetical protein
MCFLPSDATQCDLFPQSASCKCYFFDNLGKLSSTRLGDGSDRRFNDVLRRRFLRQGYIIEIIITIIIVAIDYSIYVWLVFRNFDCAVRFKERRRKAGGSLQRRHSSGSYFLLQLSIIWFTVLYVFAIQIVSTPIQNGTLHCGSHSLQKGIYT